MTLSAEAFREQFLTFSRSEVTAFLAELWTARGWEGETAGDLVVLRRSDSARSKTLYPIVDGRDEIPEEDVDAVILATGADRAPPDGFDVYEPVDLYQMARYGLDGEDTDRLLGAHFDPATPQRERGNAPVPPDRDRRAATERDPRNWTRPADSPFDGPDDRPREDGVAGDATADNPVDEPARDPADEPADESTEEPAHRETDAAPGVSRRSALLVGGALLAGGAAVAATRLSRPADEPVRVPGVSGDGVADPAALADAHAAAIEETSYSLDIDHVTRGLDRRLRSYLSMDLNLAADRSFLTFVSTAGPEAPAFLGEPPAAKVYWSDGEEYLAQSLGGPETSFHSFEPPDGYAGTWQYWANTVPFGGTYGSGPERYYRTVFEAVPTRLVDRQVVDGDTVYRVVGDVETPDDAASLAEVDASDVRDVSLSADVDSDGVVRSLVLEFAADADGAPVALARNLAYAPIDRETVVRPTRRAPTFGRERPRRAVEDDSLGERRVAGGR